MTLALELDSETEARLDKLAKLSGRTAALYVREAILEHLEEVEDTQLALERLAQPAPAFSAQEVKRELSL